MTHQILNGVVERRRKCRRRDDPAPSGISAGSGAQLVLVDDDAASGEDELGRAVHLRALEDVEVDGLEVDVIKLIHVITC